MDDCGPGILHEEKVARIRGAAGVQLGLIFPQRTKWRLPHTKVLKTRKSRKSSLNGVNFAFLAGEFEERKGYISKYLPLTIT